MVALGLDTDFGENAFVQYGAILLLQFSNWEGYLARNDSQRASDIMAAFQDPTVKFIVANRYCTNRTEFNFV